MKISEMIKELAHTMSVNGDQELVIMTDGKRFPIIEVYTDDERELYLEGYEEPDEFIFAVNGFYNVVASTKNEATNIFYEADFGELKHATIKEFDFFDDICTMKIAGYYKVTETDEESAMKKFTEADFGELFFIEGTLV